MFPCMELQSANSPWDREFVQARNGDSAAFERLLHPHMKAVKALAGRLLGHPDDADEVMQEVLLAVYLHLDGFRGDCAFRTWLFRIAYNFSIAELRRRKRMPTVALDDVPAPPVRLAPGNPEQLAIAAEKRRKLAETIHRLPPAAREVLVPWVLEDRSIREIAGRLGLTEGTAKTRLHRARKQWMATAGQREFRNCSARSAVSGRVPLK